MVFLLTTRHGDCCWDLKVSHQEKKVQQVGEIQFQTQVGLVFRQVAMHLSFSLSSLA